MRVASDTNVAELARAITAELQACGVAVVTASGKEAGYIMTKGVAASYDMVPNGHTNTTRFVREQGRRGDLITAIEITVHMN